jgi:hypothetical protein
MDREFGQAVPKEIARAFKEARTCFRSKAYTAAAIMCRKTLEGICSAHGVKTSCSLAVQLKKLKDNGTIENRLFEGAEALRTMGNEAAHGVELVTSAEDARDTLEFTDALYNTFLPIGINSKLSENAEPRPNHRKRQLHCELNPFRFAPVSGKKFLQIGLGK